MQIDIAARLSAELATIDGLLDSCDLNGLLQRYPLRETPALTEIARNLGFQGRRQYEEAVRKLLMDDEAVLTEVRTWFGDLSSLISP